MGAEEPTRAVLGEDGRVLIEQPEGSYRPAPSRTDRARVRAKSDEQVEAVAASQSRRTPAGCGILA